MTLGRVAAETLLDQIEGRLDPERTQRIEIVTELVLRDSCRAISG